MRLVPAVLAQRALRKARNVDPRAAVTLDGRQVWIAEILLIIRTDGGLLGAAAMLLARGSVAAGSARHSHSYAIIRALCLLTW